MTTDCDEASLKTDSEEEVIPLVPTDPESNGNGSITKKENFEVNEDIIEEDETQIVQSTLETKSDEEEVPLSAMKSTLLGIDSHATENDDVEEKTPLLPTKPSPPGKKNK